MHKCFIMGCLLFMYRKRKSSPPPPTHTQHVANLKPRSTDENNAFNAVNRSRNFKLIEMDVNEAARLYLKTYGKLPDNVIDEISAKQLFVQLISAKSAHIAVSTFNIHLSKARSSFIEENLNDSCLLSSDGSPKNE